MVTGSVLWKESGMGIVYVIPEKAYVTVLTNERAVCATCVVNV